MSELDGQIAPALQAIGAGLDTPVHDGWLDPDALATALGREGPVVLRAQRRLETGDEGFGHVPLPPAWVRLDDDGLRWTPLREAAPHEAHVAEVRLQVGAEAWPDHAWGAGPTAAELWLDGDDPLLVAEWLAPDEATARAAAAPLLRALRARLGAGEDTAEHTGPDAAAPSEAPPLPARLLARWSLRREGGVLVLRDHTRRGPAEAVAREALVTATCGALAVGAGIFAWLSYQRQSWEQLALSAVVSVVSAVACFTFLQVTRHSARYRASSEALAFIGYGGFVVSPWLGRDGSVRTDPEGRFGAALRVRELEEVDVIDSDGATLRFETGHGPYDVGSLPDAAAARRWGDAILRFADGAQPGETPAARQDRRLGPAAAALLLLASVGCTGEQLEVQTPDTAPPTQAVAPPPVEVPALRLIDDDIEAAKAQAAREGKVVFAEVWAPWCHTCRSMKQFVLPDPSVAQLSDRVVFAALDSDRPANAAFLERYTVDVWPTLYVLTPDGEVLGRWLGAASVAELRRFLREAADLHDAEQAPEGPLAKLVEGHRQQAEGAYEAAAQRFQEALELAPEGWPRRSEAIYGRVHAFYRAGQWASCVEAGEPHLATVEGAATPTDLSWALLRCAEEVGGDALQATRDAIRARLARHVARPPAGASVDDRADALGLFATVLDALDEGARAREQRERAALLLEGAAHAAPGPEEASTFDYARMKVYLKLGRDDDAIAMLQRRRSELPDDYEPHARLAETFLTLDRAEEALPPLERALSLAYGPRRLRYLDMLARAHRKLDRAEAEREALEALLKVHEALEANVQARWSDLASTARERLRALPPSG